MLAAKKLAGVTPEVTLRDHMEHVHFCTLCLSMNKVAHSSFETQRICHRQLTQGPVKRGLCLQKVSESI